MTFTVRLTLGAERDLEALYDWMAVNRSRIDADALLDGLLARAATLTEFPLRGAVPAELASLGMTEFRQLLLPPYRIIYRVIAETVFVMLIADGRRDMQTLLQQRLLD